MRVRARFATMATLALLLGSCGWFGHPQVPDVAGQGLAGCQGLHGHLGLGSAIDERTVDGVTAAAWVGRITGYLGGRSPVDAAQVSGAAAVTVCVMTHGPGQSLVVLAPGLEPVVYPQGGSFLTDALMKPLDQLWHGGAATTDAPFRCPATSTRSVTDVSTSLPTGATAALLCLDGGTLYTPHQVLTTGVDQLVEAIDARPIVYSDRTSTCSLGPGSYDVTLVFEYPTGTRTVSQEACRGLALGPFTRANSGQLDLPFLTMLQHQLGKASGVATPPPCQPPSLDKPTGVGDLRHLVAARYCPSGDGGRGQILTGRRLRTLREWGAGVEGATTEPEGPCARPAGGWPHLSLSDAWGNSFTMTVECQRPVPAVRSDDTRPRVLYPLSLAGITADQIFVQLAAGTSP